MSIRRFELLFSRAAPHSVDLKQLAAQSIDLYGEGAPRRRTLMERLAGLPVKETVKGSQTHVTRVRTLSALDEIGVALGGLDGGPFLAAMYSMALDGERRPALWAALREAVATTHKREAWPTSVPSANGDTMHYGDELCSLVLDEDWFKPIFDKSQAQHNVNLYAIALGVTEEVWRAKLFRPFLEAKIRYERWLGIARGHVDRRIFEEFHRADLAEFDEAV